ncbi:MAG: hypothetical protein ABI405_07730 [Parafilimonas sp.]
MSINSSRYNFYLSVWNKYVPVIRILLKKSAAEEQSFNMNRIDFERAGGIRKSGYKFVVNFIGFRPDTILAGNELVQSFIYALQNDETVHQLLSKNNYKFTLNTKYQLQIKNNGLPHEAELPELSENSLAE